MNPTAKQKPKNKKYQPKNKKYQSQTKIKKVTRSIEIPIETTKDEYVTGYKSLQSSWKTKDKELLLVGRLAYWVYWISKLAEKCERYTDTKTQLFTLKKNGLLLLSKSDYVQIKKYVPPIHRQMCYKHRLFMHNGTLKPLEYLEDHNDEISKCPKCAKGIEHYYTLYSVAILNEKADIDERKPLFIMTSPYTIMKDEFPALESLEAIKKHYGNETISVNVGELDRNVNVQAFKEETIIKYFNKNYNDLSEYLNNK